MQQSQSRSQGCLQDLHACSTRAHPVGVGQVCDGRAFCQELRVAQYLKVNVQICAVAPEDLQKNEAVAQPRGSVMGLPLDMCRTR